MHRLVLSALVLGLWQLPGSPSLSGPPTDSVVGVVRPMRWVRVAAETDGRVLSRKIDEHAGVEKDAVVLQLDSTLKSAQHKIARAQLLNARSRLKLAEREWKRARELDAREISSAAELDRAEAEECQARAAVMMAEAEVEKSRFLVEKTTLRAPFAGILARVDVEQDEYVVPGKFVFSVMELKRIKIESFVSDALARQLAAGDEVEVQVAGRTAKARIKSVAPGTDNESRTFKVVVTADNPLGKRGYLFRPGTTVNWKRANR